MINLKLKTIANLINQNDYVLDIGTDHAYLPIYLVKNNICENVICSDISENVINVAKNNIKENDLDIPVYLSNGLKSITDKNINTLIVSGMGTFTIIDILQNINNFKIDKMILSSNNNLSILREYIYKINYYIDEEITVFENNKWYVIMKVLIGNKKLTKEELQIGKFNKNNYSYYQYLLDKYNRLKEFNNYNKEIKYLEEYINAVQLRK